MPFRLLTAGVVPALLMMACNSGTTSTGAAGAGQTERTATAPSASPPSAAPQTATPSDPQPVTPTAADDPAAARTPVAGRDDNMGPLTEGQIASVTDGLNKGEIEQAKIAQTKSKNKDVLAFARMMISHHGQATKQLAALKETPETSPLAIQMQGHAQSTLARLNQANGADFDLAYLDAQVQGHQEALDTLRQKLLPSATSPELTKYLKGLQPTIEQHLQRATQLRDQLASAQGEHGSTPPSPATSADAKSSQLKRVQQPDEAKHHASDEQTSSSAPATGKR